MKKILVFIVALIALCSIANATESLYIQRHGGGTNAILVTPTLTGEKDTVVPLGACTTTMNVTPSSGSIQTITLNGSCNIIPAAPQAGQSFSLQLTQSATTAPTFDASMKWPGAIQSPWSIAATKYDMVSCVAFGTSVWWC